MSIAENLACRLRESANPLDRQGIINEARSDDETLAICGVSFAGCDLTGLNFIGVPMTEVDFCGSICRDVQFTYLEDCIFDGVDATRSSFPRLDRCQFRGATMVEAEIGGRFAGCDFSECTLSFAHFGHLVLPCRVEYGGNRFDGADLHGVDAAAGYFVGTSFREARLTDARLSRSDLSGCDLRAASLAGANLSGARLTGADTSDAIFEGCVINLDQADALGPAFHQYSSTLRIFSPAPGPQTANLVEELAAIPEYRLDWRFHPRGTRQAQKIMITNRPPPGDLHGYAFQADTHDFIRMYPMDEHPNVLPAILLSIAADYADWEVDPQSAKVQLDPPATARRVGDLVHGMLGELFRPAQRLRPGR